MGGVRRIARQSFETVQVFHVSSAPTLTDNWTTEETTTYNELLPANAPAAWGGTLTNLDRVMTATGSTRTALGALLTFVTKPDQISGAILKVQVTYAVGSACHLELWTKSGSTWTKTRRVSVAPLARSGDTFVLDLTTPIFEAADVDAIWITLAPDLGTETLTWTCLHLYGVCNNDPVTPNCPPGAEPTSCDPIECAMDPITGICLGEPDDTDVGGGDPPTTPPTPITDPIPLPPIIVPVAMPTSPVKSGADWFQNCPRPTKIIMYFGDIPGGGSVTVTLANAHGLTFTAVLGVPPVIYSQTIAAPGTMEWCVSEGFRYFNGPATPALPPARETPTIEFLFTRKMAASNLVAAASMFDILMYWWTVGIAYVEVC